MQSLQSLTDAAVPAQVKGLLIDYLEEEALARELALSLRSVQRMRARRLGPPHTVIGRKIYYRIEGVRHWLVEREISPDRAGNRRAR